MNWVVNDEYFTGKIAVGDTLECNGIFYSVIGINEDGIVVKALFHNEDIKTLPLEGK